MLHEMKLQEQYFFDIKNGTKCVEVRLNDEKRQKIQKNDVIRFWLLPDHREYFDVIVTDLKRYLNFNEVVDEIPIERLASIHDTKEQYLNDLNQFYSKEEQEKDGVLAITIELPERYEKSCGIIVFKNNNQKTEVLLVKHVMGHFGFPKGHVEENETEEETAIRETKEETNVDTSIISGFKKIVTYSPKEHTIKDVVYFVGEAKNNELNPQLCEIKEVFWLNIEEANHIIRTNEVNLLKEAFDFYTKTNHEKGGNNE